MNEMTEVYGKTKEYRKFRLLDENRQVIQKKVNELIEGIKRKNMLRSYPIVVRKDYGILDGQHRWYAAQALNVYIYYIVDAEADVYDIAFTNSKQTKWKLMDYVNHYSARGFKEYEIFKEFMMTHEIAIDTAITSFGLRNVKGGYLQSGDMQVSHLAETAAKTIGHCKDFQPYFTRWNNREFVGAIRRLLENPDYKRETIVNKLEYLSSRLVPCVSAREYYKLLGDIYNYKTSNKVFFGTW